MSLSSSVPLAVLRQPSQILGAAVARAHPADDLEILVVAPAPRDLECSLAGDAMQTYKSGEDA